MQAQIRIDDILNEQEQEAIEKLNYSKSSNSNKSEMYHSLSNNPKFEIRGPLEKFQFNQQANSILIIDVKSNQDLELLMEVIDENKI